MSVVKPLFKRRAFRIIIPIIIVAVIVIPTWIFLDSIHYKVLDYFFTWDTYPLRNFSQHEQEFNLLVKEIDEFVKDQPDFFEDFTGKCSVKDDGLVFYRIDESGCANKVFHKFTSDGWEKIKYFREVFPHELYFSNIMLYPDYPDYIFFCSDERSWRVLVYTRGERPNELIDRYWEKQDFVRVREVAPGWFDLSP